MWLNKLGIFVIICLAFVIRLISLNQSLWWDEAINVVYARQNDFWWYVTQYPLGDFHPPGWFMILWVWGHLFGWLEISVRMPSVIFGIGTVYVTYLIGKELFSKKVGLLAALMLSLAPLHIYYSQEARMYAFSAFAVSFSIYSLILLISKKRYSWLIFMFSAVLVLYSDYVAYFIFPVQFIYLLFFERTMIKTYLLSFFGSLVIFAPWVFIFPKQLVSGEKTALIIPGWKDIVGSVSVKESILLPIKILVGRISFDNKFLYYSLVVLTAIPYLFVLFKIKEILNKKYYLILLWLMITPLLVWFFSFIIPIFSYFRLLYILPAFYIAVAVCLCRFSSKLFSIFITVILIFEFFTSSFYLFNNNFQREDWKGAINFINQTIDNKSVVLFKNNEIAAPYIYYNDHLDEVFPAFKVIPVKSDKDIQDLNKIILGKREVYVFEYLTAVTDPNNLLEKKLENLHLMKVEIHDFIGVGFVTAYRTQK